MTAYTCHCGTTVNPDAAPSPGEPDTSATCWDAAHPHRHDCQTCLDLRDHAAEERAEMDQREREAS